jgi:protein-S-isoprenylcysteine O-methyltransferase Ste14
MADDQIFRTILIVAAATVLPVGLYYRLRSQSTGEKLDRWQEGRFILFTLRPIAAVTVIGLFAYMINPDSMAWASMPLPAWLRWVGVGCGIAGATLLIRTFQSLGKNLTDTVVTRRQHTLVTKGPYKWVRHPFYDAGAIMMLANALVAANWFVLVGGVLSFSLLVLRTRREEDRLLARFGDSYRSYMERTGRFLPKIR